jgi:hypothetical protein
MGNQKARNPVISPVDYTPRNQPKKEEKLDFDPCLVCGKKIEDGYYARFGNSGTCSKTCMKVQDGIEKYPGHPLADFLKRFKLE